MEVTPFVVVVDNREGLPYRFSEITADSGLPLLVRTDSRYLATGDYAIEGYESRFCIERKSHEDAYRSFTTERDLHVAKLERMAAMEWAAVVVECGWDGLIVPPAESRANPKSVFRSVLAWMTRYPTVHWVLAPDRAFAERITFRLLERCWKERQRGDDMAGRGS